MTEELLYGTTPMKLEPLNITFNDVAWNLRNGNPVVVELEPGDMTYYALLIVPAALAGIHHSLGRFGIPWHRADRYLIVSKLSDQGGQCFFARQEVGPWDLEILSNPWSRELLAWWLRALWREIHT